MEQDLTNYPDDFSIFASEIPTPEGPAVGPDGLLYLVSADDGKVLRVSPQGQVETVAETGGRPNGIAFNSSGEMFVADTGLKSILHVTRSGSVDVFIDEFDGTSFGGPNDLCFLPTGDLLFTDPIRRPAPDPAISPVYKVNPSGEVSAFANDLAYPNGIALASEHTVYISESRAQRLVSFTFDDSGALINQSLIRRFRDPGSPDGMAIDSEGNILQTLPGIKAIAYVSSDGELIDLYHLPSWKPANLAFGGDDMKTVYVCGAAQSTVYKFTHKVAGKPLL
jgi:gluconolactonase